MRSLRSRSMGSGKRLKSIVIYTLAALATVYLIAPFVWLVLSSFQREADLLSVPPKWLPSELNLTSYRALLTGHKTDQGTESGVRTYDMPFQARIFPRSLLNSLIVAASVAILAVGIGAYAAYALARLEFFGRNLVMFFILGTRMIPAVVLAVPFYMLARRAGLLDHLESLVMLNLSFILPYVISVLRAYFQTIPRELEEAGRIDGCSRVQVVQKVILPLSLPGLVAAGILAFMLTWGEFFFALILSSSERAYTSTVVASMFATDVDIDYVTMITAGVLAVLPPVGFALIFQRYIVSGLLAGSVKG